MPLQRAFETPVSIVSSFLFYYFPLQHHNLLTSVFPVESPTSNSEDLTQMARNQPSELGRPVNKRVSKMVYTTYNHHPNALTRLFNFSAQDSSNVDVEYPPRTGKRRSNML